MSILIQILYVPKSPSSCYLPRSFHDDMHQRYRLVPQFYELKGLLLIDPFVGVKVAGRQNYNMIVCCFSCFLSFVLCGGVYACGLVCGLSCRLACGGWKALTEPERGSLFWLGWFASKSWGLPVPMPQSWHYRHMEPPSGFCCVLVCLGAFNMGDLNSGPHACTANIILAEPPPQPSPENLPCHLGQVYKTDIQIKHSLRQGLRTQPRLP